MTNEEAIAYGKRVISLGLNDETQSFCELAINALETVERIKARRRELEIKMHNSFSLSEATEHYALTKLLRETENDA